MLTGSALSLLLALAHPAPQESRSLASFLADVNKRTGIYAVAVPILEKQLVSCPSMDSIDAANVETHLLTTCAKLATPGRLVRLYLPKGPSWKASEILDYAKAQASLYQKPIGDLKDDSIEVLGKLVPKSEAPSLIKALDLRPVYVVLPKFVSFAGRWQTTYGEMVLTQKGNQVTGTYGFGNGRIQGTVNGSDLRVVWFEQNLTTGNATWTLADDGMAFAGPWFNSTDLENRAGIWTGTRVLSEPGENSASRTGATNLQLFEQLSFARELGLKKKMPPPGR